MRTRDSHESAREERAIAALSCGLECEVMAQHQIFTATELVPLLRERGIDLSAS
jgi:hypothetical protein